MKTVAFLVSTALVGALVLFPAQEASAGAAAAVQSNEQPGYLGVSVDGMTDQLREHFGAPSDAGVLVSEVGDGTPAQNAGLTAGDVIVAFDGQDVTSSSQLARAIRRAGAGSQVTLELVRNGRLIQETVELGAAEQRRVRWTGPAEYDGNGWSEEEQREWNERWEEFGERWAEWGEQFGEDWAERGDDWAEWGADFGERWADWGAQFGERWAEWGAQFGERWAEWGEQFAERFDEDFDMGENVDWDAVEQEVERALAEVDWDEINVQIENSMNSVDWDEINRSMERAMEQVEIEGLNAQIRESIQRALQALEDTGVLQETVRE